jgi:adenosylcobinamide-GDP ribazoletransferase
MLLTGALHEDGLTDCADAFGATRNRERALEILRDSRIGVFGAAALVFSILLRWAAIASLSLGAGVAALLIAHAVSRAAIALGPGLTQYARSEGTGALVAGGIDRLHLLLTLAVAVAIAILFGGWAGLFAALVGTLAAALMLAYAQARIGGYTGDVLGAMQQVAEIAILCVLAGQWAA